MRSSDGIDFIDILEEERKTLKSRSNRDLDLSRD